jgi:hypothetical protein
MLFMMHYIGRQPKLGEYMSETDKIDATTLANSEQKSLELLFDYTKFHIGVYLTLTASFLTAATANINDKKLLDLNLWLVWPAVIAFVIAGFAGGVIASSITQHVGGDSLDFLDKDIGPANLKKIYFKGIYWTYIEHTSFWIGLLMATLSFI